MSYKIVEKLGRAGNGYKRKLAINKWDDKYGKNNWEVVYYFNDQILTRQDAPKRIL